MKTLLTFALIFGSITAFAEEGPLHLSCRYNSTKIYKDLETVVSVTCNEGNFDLVGVNNSPCKASNILREFASNLIVNETIVIDALTATYSGMDGMQEETDVTFATRENSTEVLVPASLIQHGKEVKCRTTQVQILRARN